MRAIVAGLLVPLLLAAHPPAARAQGEPESVRRELLRRINEERGKAGSPLLRRVEALDAAAQQHAEDVAREGNLRLRRGSEEAMTERLRKSGYAAHEWTESVVASNGDLASVLHDWKSQDNGTYRSLMDSDFRDLGIGVSRLRGIALYTFVFAVPEGEHFARATASLRNVAQVRAGVLEQVNILRRRAGAPPLRVSPLLEQAAQKHADDMLARGYFGHESPNGASVRERARDAGYTWREIGENIAEGQHTVAEVMEGWVASREHKRNMLDPGFVDLGVGLALGKGKDGEYRVLWVQDFGAPKK